MPPLDTAEKMLENKTMPEALEARKLRLPFLG
jgi:hypothetical protein